MERHSVWYRTVILPLRSAPELTDVFHSSDEEPAHYAQGRLIIPKETRRFLIRFRIQLPEVDAEQTYDIELEVSH